ncbi:MAG: ROK family protein [Bacteroidales bacterium]|nr:MAG: ROK family protein [Bacteroidales bacterium]
MKFKRILGIDIGGSGIKGSPVDIKSGELVEARHRIPTPVPATPESVAVVIKNLVDHFNWNGPVGCGFPAVVQNGIVKTAANIDKSWIGCNAQELFTKTTGLPTLVINDADSAGMAEVKFGAGKKFKGTILLVTVGTGIGSVVFIKGRLLPNTEFGHIYLNSGQDAELFASDAVRKNEGLGWDEWAKRFDEYLLEVERLLWPELIIIGGGVSKKIQKFSEYLTVKAKVVPAKLQNEAGLIGAALAAKVNKDYLMQGYRQ